MITSTSNKQVKYVSGLVKKAKMRREEELFVAEGLRMCREIPKTRIRTLYVSESFRKGEQFFQMAEGVSQVEVVADSVFGALSDTRTPQGVLALVNWSHYTMEDGKIASPDDSGTSSGPWKSWNDFSGRRGGRSDWNCDGFPNRGCV